MIYKKETNAKYILKGKCHVCSPTKWENLLFHLQFFLDLLLEIVHGTYQIAANMLTNAFLCSSGLDRIRICLQVLLNSLIVFWYCKSSSNLIVESECVRCVLA